MDRRVQSELHVSRSTNPFCRSWQFVLFPRVATPCDDGVDEHSRHLHMNNVLRSRWHRSNWLPWEQWSRSCGSLSERLAWDHRPAHMWSISRLYSKQYRAYQSCFVASRLEQINFIFAFNCSCIAKLWCIRDLSRFFRISNGPREDLDSISNWRLFLTAEKFDQVHLFLAALIIFRSVQIQQISRLIQGVPKSLD